MGLNRTIAAGLLPLALLGACGRSPKAPKAHADESYAAPPEVESATRAPDGVVRLSGHAAEGALIEFRTPDGGQATARADEGGAWALTLPPSQQPRLYAFDAVSAGRSVRSEGTLAVMPAPAPPAVTLRAGFAAEPVGPPSVERLELVALDYDGGGAAAGGFAPPHSRLRLMVDGVVLGEAEADGQGRFALLAVDPTHHVAPGAHAVRVYTAQGLTVDRAVEIGVDAIPQDRAFIDRRTPNGWAVSWRLPGGGVQTSLIFDEAAKSDAP